MPNAVPNAASSSASALDAVWLELLRMRNVPEVRTVRHYHDHPGYIAALAASVREHWAAHVTALPLSENFLRMQLSPGSCFDDGEARTW